MGVKLERSHGTAVPEGERGPTSWRGRKVALVGMGVSNRALARFLVAAGAQVVGFDVKPARELGPAASEMAALGVPLVTGPRYLEGIGEAFDAVFLSPGVDRRQPPIAAMEQRRPGTVSTEMELFFRLCPAPIVGVTGSSGKTTTTTMIGRILERGERPVWVGGNIGNPLIDRVDAMDEGHWAVVELSSFQLEWLGQSPHIAVMTNFSPNHLDVHPSLDAYRAAKGRIFAFQTPSDWAVFNADDPETARLAAGGAGAPFPFSRRRTLDKGAFLDGQRLVVRGSDGRQHSVLDVRQLQVPGWHNVENALAAAAVGYLCGIAPEAIGEALRAFRGVPHRLEWVRTVDGVRYVNDSIATSPARAAAGLRAFDVPIVLIAGGYDKKLPFDPLIEAVAGARVRAVILLGATADAIADGLNSLGPARRPPVYRVASLAEAVEQARRVARRGDVVLLSPACASYDMFPNFEVRGETFRRLVAELT